MMAAPWAGPPAAGRGAPQPGGKLSASRLDPHKFASPFAGAGKAKTPLSEAYNRGDIPCRIEHHSSHMSLHWSTPVPELSYDPLLPWCFEGLRETTHPYTYISRQAITDMLTAPGAPEKVIPLVDRIVPPLRVALLCKEDDIFGAALRALELLSTAVGPTLNPHVHHFLAPLSKRLAQRPFRDAVERTLRQLEAAGGPAVGKLIKQKVPTYTLMT